MVLAVSNLVSVVGIAGLAFETKRARAPVAALGSEVSGLVEERGRVNARVEEAEAKIDDTRTSLSEARVRLAEQEAAQKSLAAALESAAERQRAVEREAKARDAKQDRDIQQLGGRVGRVEQRVFSLTEALDEIDRAQGKRPSPP